MKRMTVQEAREVLGKEFDIAPDETIELMITNYNEIARILVKQRFNKQGIFTIESKRNY